MGVCSTRELLCISRIARDYNPCMFYLCYSVHIQRIVTFGTLLPRKNEVLIKTIPFRVENRQK
jgi:hypothetical protein